jgi:hypothetical protein
MVSFLKMSSLSMMDPLHSGLVIVFVGFITVAFLWLSAKNKRLATSGPQVYGVREHSPEKSPLKGDQVCNLATEPATC